MAVKITIKAGRDAAYYTRNTGGKQPARGADYYLSATSQTGEKPGTWLGGGLADLGIHDGDTVVEEDFLALYNGFVNPRTGEHLGSAPRIDAELRKLFAAKKEAEPGLTRERERELWIEARSEVQSAGVMYLDAVFAPDKSVSLAHASALASAVKAREADDLVEAARWEARAASVWDEIESAARTWVQYAQDEARFVRTGHHGRRIEGVEQGKFEDAHEIPVAIFPHHCNRDGQPSLHFHTVFLNRVKTVSDGKWRAIDSRALHRVRGAGASIGALAMETGLSEQHGFKWLYRPKSHGRLIEGCTEKAINAFSSRRVAIDKLTLELAEEYRAEHGTEPSQRTVWSMAQHAQRLTRKGKSEKPIVMAELLSQWEQDSRAAELGSLTELAQAMWPGSPAQAQARLEALGELSMAQERELMTIALAQAQEAQAAFGRQALIHRLGENLPDHVTAAGPEHARALLESLADRVLGGEGGDRVHCLTAGEFPRVPGYLRRASGESVYRPHGAELFATEAQLTLEERVIAMAGAEKAPHLEPEVAAELLGAELDDLEAQLRDAAQGFTTSSGLSASQAAVAFNMLTSPRRAEVGIALAGAGKTYTAGKTADVWARSGMGRVIGVAVSSNARDVLKAASPNIEAYNLAELLGDLPGQPEARGWVDIGENALIIMDESSLTGLTQWDALLRLTEHFHAKLVVLGDTHQLSSPDAGGGLAMLARKLGYSQLQEVHRFVDQWQRDASVQLRAGDRQALVAYDEHGMIHGGTYEEMAEAAARAYLADYLAGKDTLLIAQTNAEARDLSRRVQGFLIEWGHVGGESSLAGPRLRLARTHDDQGHLLPEFVTNIGKDQVQADTKMRERSGAWLRAAMIALGILSATAAVVSYQAQYKLIYAYKAVKDIAALQAGIPDVASLVFACLGIALALHGKRAIRARFLNVAAVGVSIGMNALAASHGWKAMAIWTLAPTAYAVTSDTLIGVLRAYTVARQRELNADDERTPLAVVGQAMLWTLRLLLAPGSTLSGFRRWVVEEAPVAPGRKAVPAPQPVKVIEVRELPWPPAPSGPVSVIPPRPERPKPAKPVAARVTRKQATGGTSKAAQLVRLAMDQHNLPAVPLAEVSKLATRLAGDVSIHPATARRVLLAHARQLQNGGAK